MKIQTIKIETIFDEQWEKYRFQVTIDGALTMLTAGTNRANREDLADHVQRALDSQLS